MNILATITVDTDQWRQRYPQEEDGGILATITTALRGALNNGGTPTARLLSTTDETGLTITYTPHRTVTYPKD